jgi:hypothetical protein
MRRINFNPDPYAGAARMRALPVVDIPPARRRRGRPRNAPPVVPVPLVNEIPAMNLPFERAARAHLFPNLLSRERIENAIPPLRVRGRTEAALRSNNVRYHTFQPGNEGRPLTIEYTFDVPQRSLRHLDQEQYDHTLEHMEQRAVAENLLIQQLERFRRGMIIALRHALHTMNVNIVQARFYLNVVFANVNRADDNYTEQNGNLYALIQHNIRTESIDLSVHQMILKILASADHTATFGSSLIYIRTNFAKLVVFPEMLDLPEGVRLGNARNSRPGGNLPDPEYLSPITMDKMVRRSLVHVAKLSEENEWIQDNKCFAWCLHIATYMKHSCPDFRAYDEQDACKSVGITEHDFGIILTEDSFQSELNTKLNKYTYPFDCNKVASLDRWLYKYKLCLNVYLFTGDKYCPIEVLHTSPHNQDEDMRIIDLCLINLPNLNHWMWIDNMSLFVTSNQLKTNRNISTFGMSRSQVCRNCLCVLHDDETMMEHRQYCQLEKMGGKGVTETYPSQREAKYFFYQYNKLRFRPFTFYADFESILKPIYNQEGPSENYTERINTHVPISYGLKVEHHYPQDPPNWFEDHSFTVKNTKLIFPTDDASRHYSSTIGSDFISACIRLRDQCQALTKLHPLDTSIEDYTAIHPIDPTEKCHFCKLQLQFENISHPILQSQFDKGICLAYEPYLGDVMHSFLGFSHRMCFWVYLTGRRYFPKKFQDLIRNRVHDDTLFMEMVNHHLDTAEFEIPVVFHNFTGYDGHLIIQALADLQKIDTVKCIPQNGDSMMSISFGGLRFMDSIKFLNTSLDKLVSVMTSWDEESNQYKQPDQRQLCIRYLQKSFETIFKRFGIANPTEEHIEVMLHKGIFPYEYFDGPERFYEKGLPSKERFYSLLYGTGVTDEEYTEAQRVWNLFQMKSFEDYHDLYLMCDVALLAMCFERFRATELEETGFDPTHFYSLPGLAFDECFYTRPALKNNTQLFTVDLFHNKQQVLYKFVENMKRGGISTIMNRYVKVEDIYTWIDYVDANNLYGWAMSQQLPTGDFRKWNALEVGWFQMDMIRNYDIHSNPKGYLIECDLEIPLDKHEMFRHYPLAPERLSIPYWMTSPFYKEKVKEKDHDDKTPKLLLTLHNKTRYCVHIINLRLFLELGVNITRIHNVIEFSHSRWMESFISKNTRKRAVATTEFGKEIPKLKVNASYGKTIENKREHRMMEIVTTRDDFMKLSQLPQYDRHHIVSKNVVMMERKKTKVLLNRPIYIGVVVLELSKWLMYTFYYKVLYTTFGSNLRLLMTDTDSLCYMIVNCEKPMEKLKPFLKEWFDMSDYPQDSGYADATNKKIPGKFKFEFASSKVIRKCIEFVGCRSKMFSMLFEDQKDWKRAKGVKKNVLKNCIRHEDFKKALLQCKSVGRKDMYSIRSHENRLYTIRVSKETIGVMDDKVYLLDSTECVPYGYVPPPPTFS